MRVWTMKGIEGQSVCRLRLYEGKIGISPLQ